MSNYLKYFKLLILAIVFSPVIIAMIIIMYVIYPVAIGLVIILFGYDAACRVAELEEE